MEQNEIYIRTVYILGWGGCRPESINTLKTKLMTDGFVQQAQAVGELINRRSLSVRNRDHMMDALCGAELVFTEAGLDIQRIGSKDSLDKCDYLTDAQLGSDIAHLNKTGCMLALPAMVALCVNQSVGCGEIFAMATFICCLSRPPFPMNNHIVDISLNVVRGYSIDWQPNPTSFLKNICREQAAIYLIRLQPPSDTHKRKIAATFDDAADEKEKFEMAWQSSSLNTPSPAHSLLVMTTCHGSFVTQAFYGYYSFQDWLAFDLDLRRTNLPAPSSQYWLQELQPRPKFRNVLDHAMLEDLCLCIERLTIDGNRHVEDFTDLTGIKFRDDLMPTRFDIAMIRLDLTQVI
jgi:hypothetical protein